MKLQTSICLEEPDPIDGRYASSVFCHGYDVFGELIQRATWAEMVYLLFRGERPTDEQHRVLNTIAVALANPGPRDPMVHAAMCGGVGGSVAASTLMAALAVGAGQSGGGRDVFLTMSDLLHADGSFAVWEEYVLNGRKEKDSVWPALEHVPGFCDAPQFTLPTYKLLDAVGLLGRHTALLLQHRDDMESTTNRALGMVAVVAAAFLDLGFTPAEGEMLHMIMRLPGCAAHAVEQAKLGHKSFPFPKLDLQDDPEKKNG